MRTNTSSGPFSDNGLIRLKDENWLQNQRVAGKVAAGALSLLEKEVKSGTTKTMLELDKLADTYIRDNGCQPTFYLYKGFPNSVCISINRQLVHGICTDYRLQEGDKVSFDLGCTFNKAIADTAITTVFGQASVEQLKILTACEEALFNGISAVSIGKRLGCIGKAINKSAKGYGNIVKYGGHGLDWDQPHASPFVANDANENEGIRLQSNLTLALEPMLTSGSTKTWVDKDGWSVWCEAPMVSHFEHTIFLHNDHVEVITYRGNETFLQSNKVVFSEELN